jgi:N-acetylneuraminic acid mutarotase
MLRTFAAVAATVTLSVSTVLSQAPGRWITNTFAPLPQPEEEYTAVVANDRLYLLGGNRGNRPEWPRHVLEYDLAADRWSTKKPVPFPGDHMAAAALGGKVYVFGGQAEAGLKQLLNTTWEYDPAADSWRPLAPMPTARTAAGAVDAGGRLYVVGGNVAGGATVGVMEMYDPATNRWEGRPTMPTARNHPAVGAIGGKIYVIGGRLAAPNIGGFVASNTDVVEEYDTATATWRALNKMPTARSGHGFTTHQGRVYVIGGRLAAPNIGGFTASNTDVVEEYDPATNTWRASNKMPTPRSGHGFTTHQGRIYVAGGEVRDSHMDAIFRDVEVFDPAINDWYRLPPMPTARHGVNLAGYGNRLHAIGGHIAFAATGGTALHTPAHEVFEFTSR